MQKALLTLPKLGTYLVAALAGLDMNDLAHGCRVGGSSRVLGSVGVVAKSEQKAAANLSKPRLTLDQQIISRMTSFKFENDDSTSSAHHISQ